jgi:hypothetical protein
MKILVLISMFFVIDCDAQNSIKTNRIIRSSTFKSGVVSQSGKILIDTIYAEILTFAGKGHKVLPPQRENFKMESEIEYYLVIDTERKYAVFNENGSKVFGFFECSGLEIDEHTKTFVKIVREPDNRLRSYLYSFDEKQIFQESFESVGYLDKSDLIALIAEDGQNDEYYLYNIKTKNKLGPYTHFNFYIDVANPPLGMDKESFEKYAKLNIITVRQRKENKDLWGAIDLTGKELLPTKYNGIRFIDENTERMIKDAKKPENADFYFTSYEREKRNPLILFDDKMNVYEFDKNLNTINKIK